MIAGPQIISAIFLATSENWRRTSLAYLLGAALSISIVVVTAFHLIKRASDRGASDEAIDYVVLGLLVLLAIHVFRARKRAEPPKWMGRLQAASPKLSFRLGFLLLGVFPSDILTSIAVGSFLSSHGDPWWHYLPFLGLTLLLLATPSLLVLAMGHRAQELLPKVRDWMNANSWVVNEIVIFTFILLTIDSLVG